MYEVLSKTAEEKVKKIKQGRKSEYITLDTDAIRRIDNPHDSQSVWRTSFIRDVDKIINCPIYNRFVDKTQVFSLYKNDDITRRGQHVQLVSRIARTIGSALGLNLDLIEAIGLGHDLGHTPFGHIGENALNKVSLKYLGEGFRHSFQSIRVLDKMFSMNCSLQTLSGIAFHDGENELSIYKPTPMNSFGELDDTINKILHLEIGGVTPSTLEGCVVRVSDIIAYVGKDRQDAARLHFPIQENIEYNDLGETNSEIINNLIVNIIENSIDKPYIKLDESHFEDLKKIKRENYNLIYNNEFANSGIKNSIDNMFERLFVTLKEEYLSQGEKSLIYRHHIKIINKYNYPRIKPYLDDGIDRIVIDYLASMTDDYFIDLYNHLFGEGESTLSYIGYFK